MQKPGSVESPGDNFKWCNYESGHWIEKSMFYKNSARPDGLSDLCKDCDRERLKRWRLEKREKSIEQKQETADLVKQVEDGTFQVSQKWLLSELIKQYQNPQTKDKLRTLQMIADISGYNADEGDEKAIVQSLMDSLANEQPESKTE